MYVITNREYNSKATDIKKVFGRKLNNPNDELRLAVVTGAPGSFKCKVYQETASMRTGRAAYPSEKLFKELQSRMRSKKGKNVVVFVHGFNTTFVEALETAHDIEKSYDVEVILFTWPSDGKTGRYKSDKRDAIASHLALDRTLERLSAYMQKHITKENACGRGFTLMLHSMGNYLFKFLMKSTEYQGETLIFDNVILASADVNNHDHQEWVKDIQVRNRIYITINEDDRALGLSRMKFGSKQKARLGHTVFGTKASNAVYLDFSDAAHIGNDHSYFRKTAKINADVKNVFETILNGRRIESRLSFNPANGTYEVT